ncbi:MAG: IclR family transcriptional regulator [Vulcanimicrobiaceae bacterium]
MRTRALEFLDYVGRARRPVSTSEVGKALQLTLPTAHRMAVQLQKEGFLRRAFSSKKLVIGPRLARFAADVTAAWLNEAPRHAILQGLTDDVGEQCELGILQQGQIVYVDGGRTAVPASLQFQPGLHAPLHCTSIGKVFLASLTDDALRKLLASMKLERFTPQTIVEPKHLMLEIEGIRKNGFAMTNEEYVLGVVGCGLPVRGPGEHIVAGLSLSVPQARVPFDSIVKFIPALRKAATRLEATLD